MKFHPHRPDLVELVRVAETPMKAATLGRNREYPLHPLWDQAPEGRAVQGLNAVTPDDGLTRFDSHEPVFARVKDVVMLLVVREKVTQHQDIQKILMETGDQPIVEASDHDPYWGWGASRTGYNKLGRILMLIRREIRSNIEASCRQERPLI